jgi:hypothetical protein
VVFVLFLKLADALAECLARVGGVRAQVLGSVVGGNWVAESAHRSLQELVTASRLFQLLTDFLDVAQARGRGRGLGHWARGTRQVVE